MSRIPRPVSTTNISKSLKSSRANSIISDDDDFFDNISATNVRIKQCDLTVGDRVCLPGDKIGTLRYRGPTQFKPGEWAGVDLDNCQGLNDGSVNDVRYFVCAPGHGIFVPIYRVKRLLTSNNTNGSRPCSTTPSLSGRSSAKSKYFAVMSNSKSCTPVPSTKRQMRNGHTYFAEPQEYSTISRFAVQRASPMLSDQNTSMINMIMLERDKAVSLIDKFRQQVEDLEFQLEEEKARSNHEERSSKSSVHIQVEIENPEFEKLKNNLNRITHINRKLINDVKNYEATIKIMNKLCTNMENSLQSLHDNTISIDNYHKLDKQLKFKERQCDDHGSSIVAMQQEIINLRNINRTSEEKSSLEIETLKKYIKNLEDDKIKSMEKRITDLVDESLLKDHKIREQAQSIEDAIEKSQKSDDLQMQKTNNNRYSSDIINGLGYTPSYRTASRDISMNSPRTDRTTSSSRWYSSFNHSIANPTLSSNGTSSNNLSSSPTSSLNSKTLLSSFRTMRYP